MKKMIGLCIPKVWSLIWSVKPPKMFHSSCEMGSDHAIQSNTFFENTSYTFRRRQWHPTLVLLPGKSHEQRSLVGCSPWGYEESDTTEQLHFHFSRSCIGAGNGNPFLFLPGESQGQGSLVGCHLWGRTESDTTEVTQKQQQHTLYYLL